ncbi:MAG: site-2 protease family protein [Labilithrix sp.]|nr:site-2 protease family protein [Labilithrix sp.]MCW5812590.1 site-2 protease family protein [Labilithrix sp.]
MRGGFRLGQLFGIQLGVDWSWGLIFLLLTWNLTTVFHEWHPSWSGGACFVLAVVAALLFFASVVAHELAHARVAQAFGMRVREIRLFLFGGVSNLEREPPSPKAELLIAVAGPLVSITLGVLFLFTATLTLSHVDPADPVATLASLGPLGTLLFWLGPVNLVVGVFNLIPGFPLDGGRVLRALVWRATGSLHRATEAATMMGRIVGWSFVLLGILMSFGAQIPFFGTGAGRGIWLAFIGWFLSSAAERSFGALLVEEALEGTRVGHLMRRSGYVVPVGTSVREVVNDWFMRSSDHAFPVVDGRERLVGLVCVADVRKLAQDRWDTTSVSEVMTPREELAVVSPNDNAHAALRKLGELNVDQLPVLDEGLLVGMLTRADVARWLELNMNDKPRFGAPRTA